MPHHACISEYQLQQEIKLRDTLPQWPAAHFNVRATRHAAQINARAHSRLLQCLMSKQALIQPFLMTHAAVCILVPHVKVVFIND